MDSFKKRQDKINSNVEQILKEDIHSRYDDFYLCSIYLQKFAESNANISSEAFKNFINVLHNYKEYNLPNLFSIRRARQDLQKNFPELKAPGKEKQTIEAEQEHRQYYSTSRFISNQ